MARTIFATSSVAAPGPTPPNLSVVLVDKPIVDARDAAHFGDADGGGVLSRHAEVLEFPAVELDARFSEHVLEDEPADKVADREAVRFGDFVSMVRGNQTARAGHVFDDKSRIARDMLAQVARDGARVGIVTSAGRAADDNADGFAFVKRILRESS